MGYAGASDRLLGIALAITGFLGHCFIYKYVTLSLPLDLSPRFIVIGSAVPGVGLAFSYLLAADSTLNSFPMDIVAARPLSALAGWLTVPFGVFAHSSMMRLLGGNSKNRPVQTIVGVFGQATRKMQILLIVGSLLIFISWFVTEQVFEENFGAYLIRILIRVCTFIPFAMGYYWDRFRTALAVYVATFLLGLYFAFLTGSRGYVYLPLMLFFIGVALRQYSKGRLLRGILVLAPVGVALVVLGGVIGIMRDEIGRTDLRKTGEVSGAVRANVARSLLETGGEGSGNTGVIENIAFRMVPWANFVVPVMSPNDVPYRGFGDLSEEMVSAFFVARFTGVGYFSNLHSNNYGFYTGDSSSVDFGLIADSWSRGGLIGAILYSSAGAFLLTCLERALRYLVSSTGDWYIFVILLMFSVAWFDYGRTGLIYSLRGAVISSSILASLIVIDRFSSRSDV